MNKNQDQIRAAHAWKMLTEHSVDDKFVNLAKGAPALIMSNGLMQTLAFLESKGKNEHRRLLNSILSWLGSSSSNLECSGKNNRLTFKEAMDFFHESKSGQYMQATEETLEYLRWLRQYAGALKKDKEDH